ncbi:MAG: MBL fold metallo-hydrolase [Desulfobacterales bacterium]|nr:MBL fold metallo-hydrolase [Desulfobacterales bacterium]
MEKLFLMGSFTISVLASGSKGNCIYISNGESSILVDCGISAIQIEKQLVEKGFNPNNLDAIIISHEHDDHIKGLNPFSNKFNIPVFITEKTKKASKLQNLDNVRYFEYGKSFYAKNLKIDPFPISHDAAEPSGFTIKYKEKKIGIATDLGIVTALVKYYLKESSFLIIEANYDLEMLEKGRYPWPLKQRIKSRVGHLSNIETKNLLIELKHEKLYHVVLAHISETNNSIEKALSTAGEALGQSSINLNAATQKGCKQIFKF